MHRNRVYIALLALLLVAAPLLAQSPSPWTRAQVKIGSPPLDGELITVGNQSAAVLMLSGSGPNDRDETIGPNKPFRDLAEGLASHHIASLRFDKRPHTYGLLMKPSDFTFAFEYYNDAAIALALLRRGAGVNGRRLFLLGHSLGTLAALHMAGSVPGVAGVILLACPARPVAEFLPQQIAYQARVHHLPPQEADEQVRQVRQMLADIQARKTDEKALFMGATAAYWREFMAMDGRAMIAATKVPVLLLQGDKDCQVPRADADLLRAAWGNRGGLQVTFFPDLNHLFMPVAGESTGDEYYTESKVPHQVTDRIAAWVATVK